MKAARSAKKHSPSSARGRLEQRTALVTGGNAGIGLAIARALAQEGCSLLIAGRDAHSLARAGKELARPGIRILHQVCDVRDAGAVENLLAAARKEFGKLDILINNAGVGHCNRMKFCAERHWMAAARNAEVGSVGSAVHHNVVQCPYIIAGGRQCATEALNRAQVCFAEGISTLYRSIARTVRLPWSK
ncbi:MAG: hypothetical protein DMG71_20015 [Acidobacteria bacterium]|nr:MAG: hypothetical protein DMG71_20015 [Acidobacteriota bacterium]